jgi:hypothetical protein
MSERKGTTEPVGLGDAPMRAAVVSVFVSGLCLAVGAFAFFDWRAALGVLIGGVLATLNLAVFARIGQAFIARKGRTAPWGVIAFFKLTFLFGGVWMILKSEVVSGLSLAVGYGALPLGITFGSLFGPKPPDDFSAPDDADLDPDGSPRAQPETDVVKGGRPDHEP